MTKQHSIKNCDENISHNSRSAIKLNMLTYILWVETLTNTGYSQTIHYVVSCGLVIAIRAPIDHLEMLRSQMKTAQKGSPQKKKCSLHMCGKFFLAELINWIKCYWLIYNTQGCYLNRNLITFLIFIAIPARTTQDFNS